MRLTHHPPGGSRASTEGEGGCVRTRVSFSAAHQLVGRRKGEKDRAGSQLDGTLNWGRYGSCEIHGLTHGALMEPPLLKIRENIRSMLRYCSSIHPRS
jgi:hypothetical protein